MKEPMKKIKLFAAMLATVLTLGAVADVVPFGIFNSNMVLPRDRPVTVWGKADAGEAVTVAFAGQNVSATADAKGAWSVQLAAMSANANGQMMTITGKNVITLENVLVGDVWLCAGQSNMAMRYNPDNEVIRPYLSEADGYSMIRSINGKDKVENFVAESPWVVAASNTLGSITLSGYFFARRLVNELDVPIGLVDTSIPGVGIEAFLGELNIAYNRSIAPFGFKGAIWYQGESNCGEGEAYRFKMTQLVGEWREALAMPELPFYYVQLCAYGDSNFVQAREAQRMAMTMIPEPVGMACAIDIGDFGGLHPFNKYDVGERLAAWALNKTYGNTGVAVSGPLYKSLKTEGNKARLSFDHADGLKLGKKGGIEFVENPAPTMADVVKKFKVAGADGVWHDADTVEFSGGDVLVASAAVASPTAVRYAYEKNPSGVFVYNSANLPMVPFRTDYDPDYFGESPDWTPKTEVQVALLTPLGYNGTVQTGIMANAGYRLSGDFAATAVGDYTATATLEEGYQWSDHSKKQSRTVTWSIVEDLTSVGVQLWEGGPEWAMCNIPTNTLDGCGEVFLFDDAPDAVEVALGAPWRVPTDTELQELVAKCNTQWMTNGNNVAGCLFTSKSNDKSIFLPVSGSLNGVAGARGSYWSSNVVEGNEDYVYYLSVASGAIQRGWTKRSDAVAFVRAVRDASVTPKAVVPTGKTLTYTGKEQVGVEAKTGSTLSGVVKATDANDEYKATATLVDGYAWADGVTDVTREVKWSIAKATPAFSGTLAMADWKEGETASEPSGLSADFGNLAYAYYDDQDCTQAIAKPTTVGVYYVRGEVSASANWNAAVSVAKQFKITEAGGGGDEPVVPPSGDGPTVKIDSVPTADPWTTIPINYTLGGIDAATDYKVVFDVTIDGVTKAVTNAAAKLADGAASKTVDTVELFGGKVKSDHRVSVRVALVEIEKKHGVQLWENGLYWAEWNAGATKPEEFGEVGRFDNASNLVSRTFGAPWRVPTRDELQELDDRCSYSSEVTAINGVDGRVFYSEFTDKSIFFPFAGCMHGESRDDIGDRACSWSSTEFWLGDVNYANYLSIGRGAADSDTGVHINHTGRFAAGGSVRPVRDPTDPIVAADDYEIDLVSYTTTNGFVEALAADPNRIDPDAAPAQGGDYVLALDNGDGSTDYVHVFVMTGTVATFTTESDLTARVLLVGGGGGGGGPGTFAGYKYYGGGGGGAGALVEQFGLSLVAGTYGITIGAGGVGRGLWGSVGYGENGGMTTLASGETILLSAVGGGGGGSNLSEGNGQDGACGGGAGGHGADVTEAYPGGKGASGQDGGSAPVCEYCCGAGGGGMDGQGEDGSGKGSGDGGKGVVCDITGHSVYYAGGGAGGSLDKTRIGGVGGLGGGGSSFPGVEKIDGVKPGDGVGGLGGGGAGSSYLNNVGGNGGSGAVIIRYTVGGSGPRKAVVPTGKTLTYTGKEQVGVEAKTGSTLSGVVKATEANDEYKATATLIDGYEWADGLANAPREIKWSIAKATPVISGTLAMADWKEGETASEPSGLSADFGAVTYVYYAYPACEQAIAKPTTEGTYYVRGEVADSANWNAAFSAAKSFKITEAGGGGDEPVVPPSGDDPTVTVDAVATGEPWSTITVEYTLSGLDAATKYALAFEVTAKGVTRGVTNAPAILTDGAATQEVDTVALFGSARSDANAKVRVALLAEGAASGGVQLWADGPYWAECNLGASSPEGYGEMVAFVSVDEAVKTALGDSWRLPTKAEVQRLIDYCNSEWTSVDNVNGRRLTSKSNGNSIFLPVTGANLQSGFYWTADAHDTDGFAWSYSFGATANIAVSWSTTPSKLSVRAVTDVQSGGGVIAAGEQTLELVPSGDEPLLQAEVPTAKPNLVYTGAEQTGVEALDGSTLSGTFSATDANDEYTATATLDDGYEWADGYEQTAREIKWSIAKATPTVSGKLVMADWKEGETASEPSGLSADFGAVTYVYYAYPACEQAIAKPTTEGTYYVRGEVAASANWNAAVSAAKEFKITEAGGDDPSGDGPTVKITDIPSDNPWQSLTIDYELGGLDGETNYKVAFEVTIGEVTKGVTNAAAKLTDGAASKNIDTAALFGTAAKTDCRVSVRVSLVEVEAVVGVQLWENGPYWAECNLGATVPEEGGTNMTFDAAVAYEFDAPWRLPTLSEVRALVANCTVTWEDRNGVHGCLVTGGTNYGSIFLPASSSAATSGNYWSSTVVDNVPTYGWYLMVRNTPAAAAAYALRTAGYNVRAVCHPGEAAVSVDERVVDLVNYSAADGFAEALAADENLVATAPAEGGDYILKLDNGDGSTDYVHVFLTTGAEATFTTPDDLTTRVLLVGGGGGGGGPGDIFSALSAGVKGGGGGGAGALVEKLGVQLAAGDYKIVVGAGGAGGTPWNEKGATGNGGNGGETVFGADSALAVSATGGGGGGSRKGDGNGLDGGCGGGAGGHEAEIEAAFVGGAGDPGSDGGSTAGGVLCYGAGGGGMGGVGEDGTSAKSGNGGNGVVNDITGHAVYYAGGGAGGITDRSASAGIGGLGGGGCAILGQGGTGGTHGLGGGGAGSSVNNQYGAAGGSGAVIIRYTVGAPIPPEPQVEYVISYKTSFGTAPEPQVVKVANVGDPWRLTAANLPAITDAPGRSHVGWTMKDGKQTVAAEVGTAITNSVELTWKFQGNTYAIAYMDGDSELTGLEPTEYVCGTFKSLPSKSKVVKDGFVFDGWYTNATFAGSAWTQIPSGAKAPVGKLTFWAKFDAADYKTVKADGTISYGIGATGMLRIPSDGMTVTLLRDVEYAYLPVCRDKNGFTFALDLGGHTMTLTGESAVADVVSFPGKVPTETFAAIGSGNVFTISNGTIAVASEAAYDGAAIRVSNGNTLILDRSLTVTAPRNAVIAYNGAKITTSATVTVGEGFAIGCHGTDAGDTAIEVLGGELASTDGVAIYFPGAATSTLMVGGGVLTGATAVYAKGGSTTVSGGEFVANGNAAAYRFNPSGYYETGDALVIDNGYATVPAVSVVGGTFTSVHGKAVASYGKSDDPDFASDPKKAVVEFVSGGTFSSPVPEAYCAPGYVPVANGDGTYGVKEAALAFKVTVVRGEGVLDVFTNGTVSVFADGAESAELALAESAGTLELTLAADGLTIPLYQVVTGGVTAVTRRTAVYAVADGDTLTFTAVEAKADDTLTEEQARAAIVDAADEQTRTAVAAKLDAIVGSDENPSAVSAVRLAAWFGDNGVSVADFAASDFVVASVKLGLSQLLTDHAVVTFTEVAADAANAFAFEFTLVLEGETEDALALTEGDARKEFVASCIQVTDDIAAGFDGTTIAPDRVEILEGGKVLIRPEAASAAGFYRIVIPKDPPRQ